MIDFKQIISRRGRVERWSLIWLLTNYFSGFWLWITIHFIHEVLGLAFNWIWSFLSVASKTIYLWHKNALGFWVSILLNLHVDNVTQSFNIRLLGFELLLKLFYLWLIQLFLILPNLLFHLHRVCVLLIDEKTTLFTFDFLPLKPICTGSKRTQLVASWKFMIKDL